MSKNLGWISIHRQLQDNWLWKEKRIFSKAEAWIDILMTVNHTDKKVLIGNLLLEVKRGDSIKSLDSWAKSWEWNKSKVRRFFVLMTNDEMITITNEKKTTRLTVLNYDSYQTSRNDNETIVKRKRNDNETLATPNNNVNNENNENNENKLPIKLDKVYSKEINDCYNNCLNYFDIHLHPENKNSWLDTIDKLNRIDNIPFEVIENITRQTRQDDFWSKNFLSLNKLRQKQKSSGVKYIVVFNENFNNNKKTNNNEKFKQLTTDIREQYPNL